MPDAKQRFAVFPEVDYNAEMRIRIKGKEEFPAGYFRRNIQFAAELNAKFEEEKLSNVVCYSHAASVALVAALLNSPLEEEMKFAPCGIYELQKVNNGPWKLIQSGNTNHPYVTSNAKSTAPWGFPKVDVKLFNQISRKQ